MHIGLNQNLNQAISFKVINLSLKYHEMILIKNDHSDFQRNKMAFGNSLSAEQKLSGIYLTLNNKKKTSKVLSLQMSCHFLQAKLTELLIISISD